MSRLSLDQFVVIAERIRSNRSMDHINDERIIALFGITPRTLRNWKKYGFPPIVAERLALERGDHKDWHGFQIRPGEIVTPAGETVNKGQIETYHWITSR